MDKIDGIIKFVAGNLSDPSAATNSVSSTGSTGDFIPVMLIGIIAAVLCAGAFAGVLLKKRSTVTGAHANHADTNKWNIAFVAIVICAIIACSFCVSKFKAVAETGSTSMDPIIATVNDDSINYSDSKITNNGTDDLTIRSFALQKTNGVDDANCTWTIKTEDTTLFSGKADGSDADLKEPVTIKAGGSIPISASTEGLTSSTARNLINIETAITVNASYKTVASEPYFVVTPYENNVYDGKEKPVAVSLKEEVEGIGEYYMQYSTDYGETWTTDAPVDAGTYLYRINVEEGKKYEACVIEKDEWVYEVAPHPITDTETITISKVEDVTYTGDPFTPVPTIKFGDTELVNGTDFTCEYANNTNAGKATITINGIGNFTSSTTTTFTINKADSLVTKAPASKTTAPVYSGSEQEICDAGTCSGGTLYYLVSDAQPTTSAEGWSTSVPKETDAKTYKLWYYVKGDDNHNDTAVNTTAVECTIAKATQTITLSANGGSINKGDTGTFTVSGDQGTVSVKSSAETVATATVAAKTETAAATVTVSGIGTGDATITVSAAESDNYKAATDVTYAATITNWLCFTRDDNSKAASVKYTNNGSNTPNMTYKTSTDTAWSNWSAGTEVEIPADGKLYVAGSNSSGFSSNSSKYTNFSFTNDVKASGSVMSLIDSKGVSTTLPKNFCFYGLFKSATNLKSAPELSATALKICCYMDMFNGCTALTSAPELPATTVVDSCYANMFYNCTALTSAPELPATTVVDSCYANMFYNCTALTSAPAELPATTLGSSCYNAMFYGCSKLTSAPKLAATTLATKCCQKMFQNCAALTSASTLPATTLASYCYDYMFDGCSSLKSAPDLPATTLASYCYDYMFQNCTSLKVPPQITATSMVNTCCYNMFSGCSSLKVSATSGTPFFKFTSYQYSNDIYNMFNSTGGDFKGTPAINTQYYYELDYVSLTKQYTNTLGTTKTVWFVPAFADNKASTYLKNVKFYNSSKAEITDITTAISNNSLTMNSLYTSYINNTSDTTKVPAYVANTGTSEVTFYGVLDETWYNVFAATSSGAAQGYNTSSTFFTSFLDDDAGIGTVYFTGSKDSPTAATGTYWTIGAISGPLLNEVNYSNKNLGTSTFYEAYGGNNGGVFSSNSDKPWSSFASMSSYARCWGVKGGAWGQNTNKSTGYGVVVSRVF